MRRNWLLLVALALGVFLSWEHCSTNSLAWAQDSDILPEAAEETKAAPKDKVEVDLTTPRGTIRTFVTGMEYRDFKAAVTALDFSAIEPEPDTFDQVHYAEQLKGVIDRLPMVDPDDISEKPEGPSFTFPVGEDEQSSIVVVRGDDELWRFSAETVSKIPVIYELLKTRPMTTEVVPVLETVNGDTTVPSSDPETGPVTVVAPAVKVPEQLRSARRVMRTLLEGLAKRDNETSVSTLDFSKLDPAMGPYARLKVAWQLKEVIDRMERIDYSQIPDDPEAPPFHFPIQSDNQPIEIARDEAGYWRFSADTVMQVDHLHRLYKDHPIVNLPEEEKSWYDRELILGNEIWRILALFTAIFISLLAGQVVRMVMRRWGNRLEKRRRTVLFVVARTLAKTAVPVFLLIGLNAGLKLLVLDHNVMQAANTIVHIVFALITGYILFRMVDVVIELLRHLAVKSGSTLNDMLVPIVSTSLRLTVVLLVVLELATALSDKPPSSVIAGLGAGGLAIGLAAQDTIKNFFGSMMIYADRPFELGDRIIIDGHDGPVEAVGFRSTRIRTLDGHLVTVPNGEMAHKTIHNVGKRPYIRRIMNIRVAYDTPSEKVRRALEILREVLAGHEGMEEDFPPRVFLHDFLETAINIRAIYWYHPPAYWDFCDFSERLNLDIIERFTAEGIRFALPSQRLFVEDSRNG